MKWFGRKKKADEAPEETLVQEAVPEQTEEEPEAVNAERLEEEASGVEPQKRGFFGGLRKKKADTVPKDIIEQEPLPEPLEDLSEPGEGEELEDEPLTDEPPKRGFFEKLKKKEADAAPEKPVAEEPLSEQIEEAPELDEIERVEQEPPGEESPKKGLFRRLRDRLSKTRKVFTSRLDTLVLGKKEIDEELLEELEEILITSDIGVQTTVALIDHVREGVERKDLKDPDQLKQALQNHILSFLKVAPTATKMPNGKPHIIMVVGVNGVGKTTTIGKLSDRFVREGKHVLLVAADTFRAAAVEQLEIWGERVGAEVIRHKGHEGKPDAKVDPSAVVYDGMQAATSKDVDVVIIDTAGRLHTKVNLMEQLKKIRRTVSRQIPDAPHEVLLVLDATTGQNAISQAQLFHEALDITGIALTKLDGTAKGGIVVGISHSLEVPIQYIGLGEKLNDLQDFDPDAFAEALF
ncbi:MAG: signal recognition particle-docking protein FtsY [Deltaproteobacteria bacterium]|nr:signal recognition particle-docking protein FtsY [Deltaproteobacteria bacterium]